MAATLGHQRVPPANNHVGVREHVLDAGADHDQVHHDVAEHEHDGQANRLAEAAKEDRGERQQQSNGYG
jgi:hypothetical protein